MIEVKHITKDYKVAKIYGFNYTDVILCYVIVVLSFSIGE